MNAILSISGSQVPETPFFCLILLPVYQAATAYAVNAAVKHVPPLLSVDCSRQQEVDQSLDRIH